MNPKPISAIQVELTNHCNYKCRICPQSRWRVSGRSDAPFDRAKGFMSFELFRRVIDEAGEISGELNFSFFGEPMMHPEFLKFMDYLKDRDSSLGVALNTNLSYATMEIFQKLIEIELTDLRLSIDAATSETYDIVRPGKNCFDLDGGPMRGARFETICEKAERWFAMPDHRPTRHVFTVNEANIAELESFVRRWLPLLGDEDIILCKNVLTYGGKVSDALIRPNPCNAWELNMLTVDWTGLVTPCNLDTNMDLAIGSILEDSLLDLSESENRRRIERLSKGKEMAACKKCVDGNNWSRNFIFRKGDSWTEDCHRKFDIADQSANT